jgi:hypothetical protein
MGTHHPSSIIIVIIISSSAEATPCSEQARNTKGDALSSYLRAARGSSFLTNANESVHFLLLAATSLTVAHC